MGKASSEFELTATGLALVVEPVERAEFAPDPPCRLVTTGPWLRSPTRRRPYRVPVNAPRASDATFVRYLDLPGHRLGPALEAWWRTASIEGRVDVDGNLSLRQPRDERGSWCIVGRMRRPSSLRWLTVEIEMWPHRDRWTHLVLIPRSRVRTDAIYFRNGHRSLDRFASDL